MTERVPFGALGDAALAGRVQRACAAKSCGRLAARADGAGSAGRPGKAVAIRVHLNDATLELRSGRGGLTGVLARGVRGVTISRKEVPIAEWTRLLAEHLHETAVESAEARAALERLIGG